MGTSRSKINIRRLEKLQYTNPKIKIKSKLIDLILIDGRFRVACCLHCYNIIDKNTCIIFDDFLNRPEYHIVLDYYDIIEKTSDNIMVILKKKDRDPPSVDLKSKYEREEN